MAGNSVVPRVSVPVMARVSVPVTEGPVSLDGAPMPVMEGPVSLDGVPGPVHEATSLPLTRLHHLSWSRSRASCCYPRWFRVFAKTFFLT